MLSKFVPQSKLNYIFDPFGISAKEALKNFHPLTIDIINKSFQVSSYFEDFKTKEINNSDIPPDIFPPELLDILFAKIQQNDNNDINSILENIISMIPSKSISDEFQQKDQMIKEIILKIKLFYLQYNELIQSGQYNYYWTNDIMKEINYFPFYPFVPRGLPPIQFQLPHDFELSEKVQIATNGIEIFMLIDHFVFIFKLLIGTELLTNTYKRVELDPNIKDYSQIVCYGKDVLIVSQKKTFIIERELNDEWELKYQFDTFPDSIVCSDGVVLIVIFREFAKVRHSLKNVTFKIYSLNNGSLVFKKNIQLNSYNHHLQNAFLYPKFITTNGSTITITSEYDNGNSIILDDTTFSITKGQIMKKELGKKIIEINGFFNNGKNHFLSILQDSVNSSFWILNEKKIDELNKIFCFERYPCYQPHDPFISNAMCQLINKGYDGHFGFPNIKVFTMKRKLHFDIFYGLDLDYFLHSNINQDLFLFLFPSLFFNPFICHMDENDIPDLLNQFRELTEKFRIDLGSLENQKNVQDSLKLFIQYLFTFSIEKTEPILSLWILRQYQFSWYSKLHNQKMLDTYQSIFKLNSIQNVTISSLFLNIFSINSIIYSMVDIDDITEIEFESAYFTYFPQSIAYYSFDIKDIKKKNPIISNYFDVLFDLLPLISYRKRLVVTYFDFLEIYGFINLRSFYDYSLFISMAISCMLVSKNDLKWSYDNSIDRSKVKATVIKCDKLLGNMTTIYRHWKPLVNRNITEKVRLFDAKCLFVFYKLISGNSINTILPKIQECIKTNKDLQLSLDLMYSYRNKYRKSMQEKNEIWIEQFDNLLRVMNFLECKFDENDDKKALINEFMQHDYHIANNFLYSKKEKVEMIQRGMNQLLKALEDVSEKDFHVNHPDVPFPNELFSNLFDSLTRLSKFNAIEKIDDEKIINIFENIVSKILSIDHFQCINKFTALYIIQFLEACHNKQLNDKILTDLLKVFDIEEGTFKPENGIPDEYVNFIYQILVIYLVTSYDCDKLEFLRRDITEFNEYQWILLNSIIEFNALKDQSILANLIDKITDIEIFIRLGRYRSIALNILNKLNKIQKIDKIDKFVKILIEKVGDEFESFSEVDEDSSLSSYLINEIKKNSDKFVFKDQVFKLIYSSDEFTNEKEFCCSLKFISLFDDILKDPKITEKVKSYYSYAITHEHLTSSYLAMNAFNKYLSDQNFCDNFVMESDIESMFFKMKSSNDQSLIIKKIHKFNSIEKNSIFGEKSLFDVITIKDGFYFVSPAIKQSSIGSLTILKNEKSIVKIYLCEESQNNDLFRIITHFDKSNFQDEAQIELKINTILKQIKISGNNMIIFNNSSNSVRLVIFSDKKEISFTSDNIDNIFEHRQFADRKSYGMFNIPKKKSFLNKQKIEKILNDDDDFVFSNILQNNLNEKICYRFLYEKNTTLLSINEITSISENLKNDIIQSYKKYLTESTFFITAIKMVSLHPEILNYNSSFMLKLFILLILNYDKFSIELFRKGTFPFPIENIIFKNNFQSNDKFDEISRYTIQNVLNNIVNVPSFRSLFYYHIKNLYREIYSHFPRNSKVIMPEKKYNKLGFIFIPQFGENSKNQIRFQNNKNTPYNLPYLSTNPSFELSNAPKQLLLLPINPEKRNWLFNSPFEFLILLKYFIYLGSTRKERELAKSCLFEAFFIESPILSFYSIEFLKYIFLKIPYETDVSDEIHHSYQRNIRFYHENTNSDNNFYKLFLSIELISKVDPRVTKFYLFFPELISNSSQQNSNSQMKIKLGDFSIYNDEITNDLAENELKLFYTYQLYDLINLFKIKKDPLFPYFSFFKYWATIQKESKLTDQSSIMKSFILDSNDFKSLWIYDYTKEVLDSFIETDFKCSRAPFIVISRIANKLTSLQTKFQYTLLLTVVFLIYQINHLFQLCNVPSVAQVIPDFIDYLTPSSSMQLIRDKIVVNSDVSTIPRIYIDRKSVYLNPKKSESIIAQFSNEIKKLNMSSLQCQKTPWRVTFIGEEAIDASGPSRELMNEIATSIFQKSSKLTIATPSDSSLYIPFTDNFSKYKDVYYSIGVYIGIVIRTKVVQSIPFAPLVWNYIANKTIKEEDIVSVDKNLNEMFRNLRKSVDSHIEIHVPWKGLNWLSKSYTIKGKIGEYFNENEVEEFITCVINDRINSIIDPLNEIRNGFSDNIGFKESLPFGNLFSKMAQGEENFSVEDMMAVCRYRSCEFESQSVVNFWAAVRKLTIQQRSLLLKFITTQSRIPSDSSSNFAIDIVEKSPDDNLNSDDMLLGASTCFNRLYLPKYSNSSIAYQKIVTSIEYCQTMELT